MAREIWCYSVLSIDLLQSTRCGGINTTDSEDKPGPKWRPYCIVPCTLYIHVYYTCTIVHSWLFHHSCILRSSLWISNETLCETCWVIFSSFFSWWQFSSEMQFSPENLLFTSPSLLIFCSLPRKLERSDGRRGWLAACRAWTHHPNNLFHSIWQHYGGA